MRDSWLVLLLGWMAVVSPDFPPGSGPIGSANENAVMKNKLYLVYNRDPNRPSMDYYEYIIVSAKGPKLAAKIHPQYANITPEDPKWGCAGAWCHPRYTHVVHIGYTERSIGRLETSFYGV